MDDRHTCVCPECGKIAKQKISTPRIALDGTDPSFPGAYMAWEKKHKDQLKHEIKQAEKNA